MCHTEREVVAFLPKIIKASGHPYLVQHLELQHQEAQSLLSMLTEVKESEKNAKSKEIRRLIAECSDVMRESRRGDERDARLSILAEKILGHEIECCSCLVSMASKLGLEEEEYFLSKSLRKKEALEKKLLGLRQEHFFRTFRTVG